MKTKLVKTKYSDETFYVQLNEKLNIWERVDNGKYYSNTHSSENIAISSSLETDVRINNII